MVKQKENEKTIMVEPEFERSRLDQNVFYQEKLSDL